MKKAAEKILKMAIYYSGIWMIFRFLNRHKLAILMYHGVTDAKSEDWTQLPLFQFKQQMEYIRRKCHPVRLKDAVKNHKLGDNRASHAVAITFDDGFENNLTIAYPVLKEYGIPATIFLTTSFVERNGRFGDLIWTDYVTALLESTPENRLDLSDYELGILELRNDVEKGSAREIICRSLKSRRYDDKNRLIDIIGQRLGAEPSAESRRKRRGLNWEKIREMHDGGLVDFGGHTVNHEILTRLPEEMMHREIRDCKAIIEKNINAPVTTFAYPNGTGADYNAGIGDFVLRHYDCALTTIEGLNSIATAAFELRRINIGRDTSSLDFKLAISGFDGILGRVKGFLKRRADK